MHKHGTVTVVTAGVPAVQAAAASAVAAAAQSYPLALLSHWVALLTAAAASLNPPGVHSFQALPLQHTLSNQSSLHAISKQPDRGASLSTEPQKSSTDILDSVLHWCLWGPGTSPMTLSCSSLADIETVGACFDGARPI